MTAPTPQDGLNDANWARSHEAAKRDVARARQAMQDIQSVPTKGLPLSEVRLRQRYMQVLAARVSHPEATLLQLAGATNVSKDIYGARLRRAFAFAQRMKERNA